MKIPNPFRKDHFSVSGVILSAWIIFSVIFIGLAVKNFLTVLVYEKGAQEGLQQGYEQAIQQLLTNGQNCEPINVRNEEKTLELIGTHCDKAAKKGKK